VRRALGALFGGAVGKDTVSRAWHKVHTDWQAWQQRDLSQNDIARSWRDLERHFLAHRTFSDPDHLDRLIHKAIADMNRERQTGVCTNL
jgi:hypothetical protein